MSKMTWRVTVLGLLSLVNERPKQNFNRFHKPKIWIWIWIWIWKSHGIFVNLENETPVLPTTIVACPLACLRPTNSVEEFNILQINSWVVFLSV